MNCVERCAGVSYCALLQRCIARAPRAPSQPGAAGGNSRVSPSGAQPDGSESTGSVLRCTARSGLGRFTCAEIARKAQRSAHPPFDAFSKGAATEPAFAAESFAEQGVTLVLGSD
jgi:hypothetical protein